MDFPTFIDQLLIGITRADKSCLMLIDKNENLVKENLNEKNIDIVKGFVDDLFFPIMNEKKKFKVIEKVLKHSLMTVVLREFEKSNILIKACEDGSNKKAIEWLLTMNIDVNIQNEEGKTALMYAVQRYSLESVIDSFLKNNIKDVADKDGNTAIFYACSNTSILRKLLKSNLFDCNHINNDNENALFYCVKYEKLRAIDLLLEETDIDCNLVNNVGKTVAILLAENTRFNELKSLVKARNIDVNYKNKFDETLVSAFIKKYYDHLQMIRDSGTLEYNILRTKNFANTLKTLVELGCDFNCVLDGDGNTPALFYLMIKDYISLKYLLKNCGNLDLSIKNKYGINFSFLSLFLSEKDLDSYKACEIKDVDYKSLKWQIMYHKTFDYNFTDSNNNNLLTHLLVRNDPNTHLVFQKMSPEALFCVNNKNENSIIIATKLGNNDILKKLLDHKECTANYVNTQDYLGNTALHYAVQLGDQNAITLLKNHNADPSIKNKDGKEAMELSENPDDPNITIVHTSSLPSSVMENQSEKQKLLSALSQKTDEDVNQDIKNYRINVFQKEYEYLVKNDFLAYYKSVQHSYTIQKWLYISLLMILSYY